MTGRNGQGRRRVLPAGTGTNVQDCVTSHTEKLRALALGRDQLIISQFLPILMESHSPKSVSEGAKLGGDTWLEKVGSEIRKPREVHAMVLATEASAQWLL